MRNFVPKVEKKMRNAHNIDFLPLQACAHMLTHTHTTDRYTDRRREDRFVVKDIFCNLLRS